MSEYPVKELTIVTPEHVRLKFQTAGLGSRALAHIVDGLLLAVVNIALFAFMKLASGEAMSQLLGGGGDYALAAGILLGVALNVGYFVAMEYFLGGQTLGKRWLGLRVLHDNGQTATFLSIIIRNLFRLLDMLPGFYFLGGLVMMFSSKDKRIGDMVAGTIVVVELQQARLTRKKKIAATLERWGSRVPRLELDEAARSLITHEDWTLLAAWIERLSTMSRDKAEDFSLPITRHLAGKLGHNSSVTQDSTGYLIALYEVLREEWEI